MSIIRWSDDRLDDLNESVKRLSDMRDLTIRLESSVGELHTDVTALSDAFDAWKVEEAKRQQREADGRKADRRWLIGTVIASAAVIVAALALFL